MSSITICLNNDLTKGKKTHKSSEDSNQVKQEVDKGKKRMKLPNSGIGYMCEAMVAKNKAGDDFTYEKIVSRIDPYPETPKFEFDFPMHDMAESEKLDDSMSSEKCAVCDPIYSRIWIKGDGYHYKYVILPQKNTCVSSRNISNESEWRALGINLPNGYALYQFESAQILLFRRPATWPQVPTRREYLLKTAEGRIIKRKDTMSVKRRKIKVQKQNSGDNTHVIDNDEYERHIQQDDSPHIKKDEIEKDRYYFAEEEVKKGKEYSRDSEENTDQEVDPGIIKGAIAKASMSRPPIRPEAIIMALLLRETKRKEARIK